MKYQTIIALLSILILSCQSSQNGAYPDDLEGKKLLLTEKKAALKTLQGEVDQLREEIASLDPSLKEKSVLVSTMPVVPQNFERYINIQGTIIADDVVSVVSELPGRIVFLKTKEGDLVQKGELIAELDLESINKQIQEVETSLELADDVFERQSRLWNQNIGSEMQYLEAKNTKERLEKSLETLRFQLSKSKIYAPISGTVDREITQLGEYASPGMPIIDILNVYKIKVEADLPERYLKIVRVGQPVILHFPSIDEEFPGRINQLGRTIDPANRTLKVEIAIQGRSRLLKPNLLAEISLREMLTEDAIVVPVEYILQEVDDSEFVYVVSDQDGQTRARKVYVESGEAYEGQIIVKSGLSAGDILITKGARNISDSELVEILNPLAAINE